MQPITNTEQWDRVVALPVALLLKHGARCPISANARQEVTSFEADHPELEVFCLEVTEHGALSREIADALGIQHESPQLFLLREGEAEWHTTHYDITADDISERLSGE